MSAILNLNPKSLWKNFDAMTQIPRPSGHEDLIRQFIVDFGKKLNLETFIDEAQNVIIRKKANAGFEGKPGIILQAHFDMVPQKNESKVHDFTKDPIITKVEDGKVYADNTTLGADNGIGCAAMLAILEDNSLQHPEIECFFTTNEEAGMTGARGLKPNILKGKYLINLDSEDDGELYIGCAGGIDCVISLPYKKEQMPDGFKCFELSVTGLRGGHSGDDIIHYRANSNKLLFRVLLNTSIKYDFRICDINSGGIRNAIPREGKICIAVKQSEVYQFVEYVKNMEILFNKEYVGIEEKISLTATAKEVNCPTVIEQETAIKLIKAFISAHNGVFGMITKIKGVVETSNNIASIKTENGVVTIVSLLRSSVESRKDELCQTLAGVFELIGAKVEFSNSYPGWQPETDSYIVKKMSELWKQMYGNEPKIKVIHAGLECGIIGAKYPKWEMISVGPTIKNAHSPKEYVDIKSVERFWNYLIKTIENL